MFPLSVGNNINNKNNTKNADTTSAPFASSSGGLGLLWEQDLVENGESFSIKNESMHTLLSVDGRNLLMEKRFTENGSTGDRDFSGGSVYILDTVKPVISPSNKNDDSIDWTITDVNPDTYIAYKNDEVILSGNWSSGNKISVSIEGLEEGSYVYMLVAIDTSGNEASKSWEFSIGEPSESSDSSSSKLAPLSQDFLFISLSLVAILAAVIVVTIIAKKKGLLVRKELIILKN